eukprot:15132495-Alexandrium_andersonii.AAC.1
MPDAKQRPLCNDTDVGSVRLHPPASHALMSAVSQAHGTAECRVAGNGHESGTRWRSAQTTLMCAVC